MFALVYSVNQLFQVRYGCGRHMWEVRMEDYIVYNKLGVVGSITYNMSTLFTKVSILCFYLRFSPEGTAFRVVVYCVMFVSVGYSVAGALGFSYLCRPITSSWDYRIPGKCVNVVAWYLSCAVLNAATDLVILLLPLWLIRPLRVRLSQKVAVGLILSCGGLYVLQPYSTLCPWTPSDLEASHPEPLAVASIAPR